MSHRFAALQERPVRLYLVGRLVSHSGNGAHTIAVTAVVWELTGNGTAVGVVAAAQFAPQLLAPAAGALVDRVDRRRAMIVQQACALGLAATMSTLTLTGTVSVWGVYLVTLGVGISTAVSNPLQQSLLGELATNPRERQPAIALNAATLQVGTVAGAGLAGLLLPVAGPGMVMLASPITYLVSLVLLARIHPSELRSPEPQARQPHGGEVREGLIHIAATSELRTATLSSAAVGLLGMGAIGVGAQALVLDGATAGAAPEGTLLAWVAAATAAGGIAALVHVAGTRTPGPCTLTVHIAGLAGAVAVAAVAPGLVLILAAVAAAAWAAHAHQALAQTLLHRAPAHLVGRVSGVWFSVASGGKAVAGPLAGALADLLEPQASLGVAAGLLVLAALAVATLNSTRTPGPSEGACSLAPSAPALNRSPQ